MCVSKETMELCSVTQLILADSLTTFAFLPFARVADTSFSGQGQPLRMVTFSTQMLTFNDRLGQAIPFKLYNQKAKLNVLV